MRNLIFAVILLLTMTACSKENSSGYLPENSSKDDVITSTENAAEVELLQLAQGILFSTNSLPLCGIQESSQSIDWIQISEPHRNAFYSYLESNEYRNLSWQTANVEDVNLTSNAIFVGSNNAGYLCFPIKHETIDVFVVDSEKNILFAAKTGNPEQDCMFWESIESLFHICEVDITRISIVVGNVNESELPALFMDAFCKEMLSLSNRNPYSISAIEIQSIEESVFRDGLISFSVNYAVKPIDLSYSGWWAGGGNELLDGDYDGWVSISRSVTLTLDSTNSIWNACW